MPAFKICQPEDRVAASFPRAEGMQASGSIASQTFFAMPGRPLLAWLHDMSAGADEPKH